MGWAVATAGRFQSPKRWSRCMLSKWTTKRSRLFRHNKLRVAPLILWGAAEATPLLVTNTFRQWDSHRRCSGLLRVASHLRQSAEGQIAQRLAIRIFRTFTNTGHSLAPTLASSLRTSQFRHARTMGVKIKI